MKEIFKTVKTSPAGRKTYAVSNLGRCRTTDNRTGESIITLGRKNRHTGYLTFAADYVHRLVAQAFLLRPDNPAANVVSHKSTCKEDNRASNLEYVTTAENNRNDLTNRKRQIAHCATKHAGQIIKADKDGVTRFFKTGLQAAEEIGCSHVLIYNALNKRQSARRAKGWTLQWVDIPTEV